MELIAGARDKLDLAVIDSLIAATAMENAFTGDSSAPASPVPSSGLLISEPQRSFPLLLSQYCLA